MDNKYMYAYKGAVSVVAPKTELQIVDHVRTSISAYRARPEDYQIYELVPVKLVTKTIITLERTSS